MSWTDLKDATRNFRPYYEYVMGTRYDTGIPGWVMAQGMPADNHMQDDAISSYAAVNLPLDPRDLGRENPWMDGGYHQASYDEVSRDYAPFQHNERAWQAGNLASILRGSACYPTVHMMDGATGVRLPVAPKIVDPGITGQGIVIPGSPYVREGKLAWRQ